MQRRTGSVAAVPAAVAVATLGLLATAPLTATASAANHRPAAHHSANYFFVASTTAAAASFQTTQQPASSIITGNLVNDSTGYTAIAFDTSSGSEAQAATLFPGNLVVQGPGLLCNEGVLPFACPVQPPNYPLLADATYPNHQHASAQTNVSSVGGGPLQADPAASTATATAKQASAQAGTGSANLLAKTPGTVTVGSQSSSSDVVTDSRSVTVTVRSHVSDIDIAGLVHIGAVTGTDTQRLVAGRKPVDQPSLTVTGVTVGGQSATVDSDGLHIAGRKGPSLLHQLTAKGITIEPVTVTRHDTSHGARSDVTGLVIVSTIPVKKAPYIPNPLSSVPPFDNVPGVDAKGTYISTLQLGGVGAAAAIQRQADVGLGGLGPLPVTAKPPAAKGGAPASGSTVSTGGGSSAVAPAGGGGGRAPQVAAPAARTETGFLDDFGLDRLYLVIALGSAAIFLGWRLRVATRGHHVLPSRSLPWRRS